MECKAIIEIGETKASVCFTYTAEDAHNNLSMADVCLSYIDTTRFPYARVEYVVASDNQHWKTKDRKVNEL